ALLLAAHLRLQAVGRVDLALAAALVPVERGADADHGVPRPSDGVDQRLELPLKVLLVRLLEPESLVEPGNLGAAIGAGPDRVTGVVDDREVLGLEVRNRARDEVGDAADLGLG